MTSDDVVHGFAVGQMKMEPVDAMPGKVSDVTLKFDRPGIYTFFCTRWCGLNHWRMHGTIEVSGPAADPESASKPLYVALGIDIDAPHASPVVPSKRPSAGRGQHLATEGLENGSRLFAQNCAACHGENGGGNGVFADDLAKAGESSMQAMAGSHEMSQQTPVDFTDPKRMLAVCNMNWSHSVKCWGFNPPIGSYYKSSILSIVPPIVIFQKRSTEFLDFFASNTILKV